MNTKKYLPLNDTLVNKATLLCRACKHPYRYDIINALLLHGDLTAAELSSYIGIGEEYVLEQLDILIKRNLVFDTWSENGLYYSVNEDMLMRVTNSLKHLS